MTVVFGIFMLTLLVITAVAIVRTPNLFVAVMLLGIFSLLIAANFLLLDAADVALTEAAVGAGISTVLFLGALALTRESERAPDMQRHFGAFYGVMRHAFALGVVIAPASAQQASHAAVSATLDGDVEIAHTGQAVDRAIAAAKRRVEDPQLAHRLRKQSGGEVVRRGTIDPFPVLIEPAE